MASDLTKGTELFTGGIEISAYVWLIQVAYTKYWSSYSSFSSVGPLFFFLEHILCFPHHHAFFILQVFLDLVPFVMCFSTQS